MKKNLLLLVVTLMSTTVFAQPCVPDPAFTNPGVYPDSATGFSAACVDDFYTQVITIIVPLDTTVEIVPGFPVTLPFDSIVIISFTGLPASLAYTCATSLGGCSFAGAETGCAAITGTPTAGEEGNYPLVITVDVYVGGLGTPQATEVIDWYFIDVLAAGSCVSGINEEKKSNMSLFPNPTENVLTLDGLDSSTESITITNANGQLMQTFNSITSSSMELDVHNLESGIYFVRINNSEASEVIRFVKK